LSRCSTKVDPKGKHVGGSDEWGYCDKDCQAKEETTATTTTTTTTATRTTTTTTMTIVPTKVSQNLTGSETESGTYLAEAESQKCGFRLASGFILGGEDTKRGDYPFVAVLGYDRPSGCGLLNVFYATKIRLLDKPFKRNSIKTDCFGAIKIYRKS